MIYLNAFLFSGLVCALGEIILDNTKLTPGHITSIFTVLGSILAFLGIYQNFINVFGAGASVLISNFGNMLFTSGMEGYYETGLIGIFTNLLSKSSAAIVGAVIFSFIFSIIFKPKD